MQILSADFVIMIVSREVWPTSTVVNWLLSQLTEQATNLVIHEQLKSRQITL